MEQSIVYLVKYLNPEWVLLQTLWGKFQDDGFIKEVIGLYKERNPDQFHAANFPQDFEEIGEDTIPSDQLAVINLTEVQVSIGGKLWRYVGEPFK